MKIIPLPKGFIVYIPKDNESVYTMSPHADMVLFIHNTKKHKVEYSTQPVPDNQFLSLNYWEKMSEHYPIVELEDYPELKALYDAVDSDSADQSYAMEFSTIS